MGFFIYIPSVWLRMTIWNGREKWRGLFNGMEMKLGRSLVNRMKEKRALLGGVVFLIGVFSNPVYAELVKSGETKAKASSPMQSGDVKLFETFDGQGTSTRFEYNSDGRRDPFLSFVRPDGDRVQGVPPLQSVSVSELKLIGVASSQGRVNAMIQVPDGKSYPVAIGTRVGVNRGRIRRIDKQSVTVEEPYLNIFGRTALKQVVMKLYTKKERQE